MSRYRGPRIRIIRRLGHLPGLTTKTTNRKKTPGDHGTEPRRGNTRLALSDDFRNRLIEKQKLRYNYGVSEKQLVKYVQEAKRRPGSTEDNLINLLEVRLDCILFRLGFAKTIPGARQLVNHGHIIVNNKKVKTPSFECKVNDIITVREKTASKNLVNCFLGLQPETYPHLQVKKEKLEGTIITLPKRKSLNLEIDELKVIEYYSR